MGGEVHLLSIPDTEKMSKCDAEKEFLDEVSAGQLKLAKLCDLYQKITHFQLEPHITRLGD